jgi:hypothetical protein
VARRRGTRWCGRGYSQSEDSTRPRSTNGGRSTASVPETRADGLFELRRNQVRLFYMFEPGQIIRLLGGMVKKQNRIPADVLGQMRGNQKDARERLTNAKNERRT